MSWKYQVGVTLRRSTDFVLSRAWLPLVRSIPWGTSMPYDVMRCAGTRELATIFDVGANTGQTARYLRRYFPRTAIHCFEPVPSTFEQLRENVAADRRTTSHRLALSDRAGRVGMVLGHDSEVARLAPAGECQVDVSTLDAFCADQHIGAIDLLKIDVEGHELAAFRGGATLLSEGRVRSIYAEVGFEDSDRLVPFGQMHAHLAPLGFVFCGLYEPWRYHDCRGRIAFANALFWNLRFKGN